MTQDSVLVTYTVENEFGDKHISTMKTAISDTDLVYGDGGDEFVEIIKIEPISKPDSNSYNTGILVGLVVLGVFLLKKLLK
tara:strand:+ start:422 stop:664 length:243 start_codon:yes stop_codon:yes gene_type:complete